MSDNVARNTNLTQGRSQPITIRGDGRPRPVPGQNDEYTWAPLAPAANTTHDGAAASNANQSAVNGSEELIFEMDLEPEANVNRYETTPVGQTWDPYLEGQILTVASTSLPVYSSTLGRPPPYSTFAPLTVVGGARPSETTRNAAQASVSPRRNAAASQSSATRDRPEQSRNALTNGVEEYDEAQDTDSDNEEH